MLPKLYRTNVVHKIHYKDCGVSYVGQTKRQIKTKIKQHRNNIRMDEIRHSIITDHILNHQHTFDWNIIKIMDSESNYNKRLISEMLHIKDKKNSINSRKDIKLLDESYICLIFYITL